MSVKFRRIMSTVQGSTHVSLISSKDHRLLPKGKAAGACPNISLHPVPMLRMTGNVPPLQHFLCCSQLNTVTTLPFTVTVTKVVVDLVVVVAGVVAIIVKA